MLSFDVLEKGLGIIFQSHILSDFSRKLFLIDQISLPDWIAFTTCNISQYMYCNCILTRF